MADKSDSKKGSVVMFTTTPVKVRANAPSEIRERRFGVTTSDPFIKYGSDNLFPAAWEGAVRKSVVARSIIKDKTTLMAGKSLTFGNNQALEDYAKMVNSDGKSLHKVLKSFFRDRNSGGTGYIEFVFQDGFLSMFNQDWTTARMKKDGQKVILHPNWADYLSTKDQAQEFPIYPEFGEVEGLEGLRSILIVRDDEPEFEFYGLPEAIASTNAMAIGYLTPAWNRSRIQNGMNVSSILMLSGKYSPDQAKEIRKEIKKEFTGEENQGKLFTIIKESSGDGSETDQSELLPMATASEGDWQKLTQESKEEILIAHGWYKSLTSLEHATGFDTQRILNEYYIALNTKITPMQTDILDPIRRVLEDWMGIKNTEDLNFLNTPPVPLYISMTEENMAAFKRGEVRLSAGFDFDTTDAEHNEYMTRSVSSGTDGNTKPNGTN